MGGSPRGLAEPGWCCGEVDEVGAARGVWGGLWWRLLGVFSVMRGLVAFIFGLLCVASVGWCCYCLASGWGVIREGGESSLAPGGLGGFDLVRE